MRVVMVIFGIENEQKMPRNVLANKTRETTGSDRNLALGLIILSIGSPLASTYGGLLAIIS